MFGIVLLDARKMTSLQARPLMGQAGVGSDKLISEMRVSKNGWLEDGASKLVDNISQRSKWITGLQVRHIIMEH